MGQLGDAYKSFDIDSSMFYSRQKYKVAVQLHNLEYINDARMNMAEMMGRNGMYKEALDCITPVHYKDLADYQRGYYYHVYRIIYGLMADHCTDEEEKRIYVENTDKYRDSILSVNAPTSFNHIIVLADKYNANGKYAKAVSLLNANYDRFKDVHERALIDYNLADAYHGMKDIENEKLHFIISSIKDMKSGIREYSSLRKLAVLLYRQGNVDRAYNYLTLCMDDAVACNSRWRIYEVQQMFPLINEAYHSRLNRQHMFLVIALISIAVLSLFLVMAIWYIYRQMRKVTMAKATVQEANVHLEQLNRDLLESSMIKEEYIGHYIDQCSVYIQKIDSYRKHLQRTASKGKVSMLFDELRSTQFIEDELRDFYAGFDDTFLKLFPHFVEDFNRLLTPEGQIHLKLGEKMNTELRIFALLRLGISSSTKIAHLLRYSVTTIYNYRVKIRNNALCNRDDFDGEVMKISSGKLDNHA